jgi:dTDP-4-dehydrorhamnose reductase
MTRWLVTGAGGQLGRALLEELHDRDALGVRHADLDVSDSAAVDSLISRVHPDVVINAAAFTKVDVAESEESAAYAVNAIGAGVVARACTKQGARLIHISTDYVFEGNAKIPYDESSPTGPRTAYGRTKLAGEKEVLTSGDHVVVRTAWLFSRWDGNFVTTMRRAAAGNGPIRVVHDQRGSPTSAHDLSRSLVALAEAGVDGGIYHAVNSDEATWYELARAVFERCGAQADRVEPVSTSEFPRPAARPAFSVLSSVRWEKTRIAPLRPWSEALADVLVERLSA